MKVIIACSCSLKIGVKIMKFTSNHTWVKIYNKWQVIFHEYAALNIIYFVATPLLGTWLRAVELPSRWEPYKVLHNSHHARSQLYEANLNNSQMFPCFKIYIHLFLVSNIINFLRIIIQNWVNFTWETWIKLTFFRYHMYNEYFLNKCNKCLWVCVFM